MFEFLTWEEHIFLDVDNEFCYLIYLPEDNAGSHVCCIVDDTEVAREPGTYDVMQSCNRCGGSNEYYISSCTRSYIEECKTKCQDCGFEDYWAYGFFESGQRGYNQSEKYG